MIFWLFFRIFRIVFVFSYVIIFEVIYYHDGVKSYFIVDWVPTVSKNIYKETSTKRFGPA